MNATEFLKAAMDSGIVSPEFVASWMSGEDEANSEDVESLSGSLVASGRMTAFQASHIRAGKAAELALGPYRVLDVLGTGGMGAVYRAEHRTMRRVVALKVIKGEGLKSPDAVRRFEREVQASARLEHPNIVTAFDAGESSGTHYLVMQHIDGRNLLEVVKTRGPQPVGRAVDWILQAARGLAFAHEQGVIHRDIKPGNLLVDSRGTVKILDMGLARLESPEAGQDQLTDTGQIMGTVDFMAPEQAMDTRQADARADIYSLGVTLWYLLAGRPLFTANSAMGKMLAHMQTPAPQLASVRGDVSPHLERVFQRMVAKKPEDRFQSMQQVITALESLPQDALVPETPCVLLGDDHASPGSSGTAATQLLCARKDAAAEEETAGVGGGVDTQPRRDAIASPKDRRSWSLKPLSPMAGWAIGALLLVGAGVFAFGGRREPGSGTRIAEERSGSVARATLPSDSSAIPAVMGASRGSGASPPTDRLAPPPPPAISPFDAPQAREHQEVWAAYLGIGIETINSIGAALVVIPPGRFTTTERDAPLEITLTDPFLLGRTEITQSQWHEVMGTTPWKDQNHVVEGADVAATHISWTDAVSFCAKLTERERASGRLGSGAAYRLPTEAEWEFACRAGTATRYFFGDSADLLGDHAWYGGGWNAEGSVPGGNTASAPHAQRVGLKSANPWGLVDVHGNVWEWVADWQADRAASPQTDPTGPPTGSFRGYRGGSLTTPPAYCKSGFRSGFHPGYQNYDVGFRLAITPTAAAATRPGD